MQKNQYLSKDGWTQAMTKVYFCTCCMSSDVSNTFFSMANNVKQNGAPESIVTPPVLWLQHKELGIKVEHFSDALMHVLFLRVTKLLIAYLETKIQIIVSFAKLNQSISNLAKISSLIGVPLLILQTLTQNQPLVGNLLSTLHFHACLLYILGWWKILTTLLTEQM
jgi:hypothetical protein